LEEIIETHQIKVHLIIMKKGLLLLLSTITLACSQKNGPATPTPTPNSQPTPVTTQTYSYLYIQQNILNNSCIQCHNSGSVNLTTYDGVVSQVFPGDPMRSPLLMDLINGTMPPSGQLLSSDQITYISNWISSGALSDETNPSSENTASPIPSGTADPNASFSYLSSFVFQNQCVQCHSTYGSYSGMIGSGDVIAGDPTHSQLYIDVVNGTMPPSGGSLSSDEIQTIYDWISNGALNN
jgi:mono/diheme cytochrome c family protein